MNRLSARSEVGAEGLSARSEQHTTTMYYNVYGTVRAGGGLLTDIAVAPAC